jgi:hypothetical protein
MHKRLMAEVTVGLSALTAVAAMAVPGTAAAAPVHNHGLTIAASPNPITAGEGVLIYGQLKGANVADKRVVLYHRIDPASHFTVISVTRTNPTGFYEFVRADGVVVSNRNWFVVGPGYTHSRTIHERVSAVVSLSASTTSSTTAQTVNFSGTVYPDHPHQKVDIQEQDSSFGNGWRTVATTYTGGASNFSVDHRFRTAGAYTLRAYFPGDVRDQAGESSTVNLTVEQEQNASFTIAGSSNLVTDGQPVTITGTLYQPGSSTAVQANVPVTLYGKTADGELKAIAGGTTDSNGGYSFTMTPLNNTVYRVKTSSGSAAATAQLFVGVEDSVTISQSETTIAIGDPVTISGTVTPQHSGHVIELQQLNAAGHWFNVMTGAVAADSTYSFSYAPGELGALQLRVQITGGPVNVGSDSSPVTVTVSGEAPVSSLPAAS